MYLMYVDECGDCGVAAQKYKVKNLFYSLEPVLLKQASRNDEFGIVRL